MDQDGGVEGDVEFMGRQFELEMESLKEDIGEVAPLNKRRATREKAKQRAKLMRTVPEYRQGLVKRYGDEEVRRFEEKYGD
tara:strand:- start:422 stop:664 length:243 start_codon:yes stop_codon:yes gene_type:complete